MNEFPKKYKILKKNVFSGENCKIVPIRFEDRMLIMKWRNEQIDHLRQSRILTEADQNSYFSTIVSDLFEQDQPDQILFSYLENDVCIGYGGLVHINWIDKNAEISFIINTELESRYFKKHWGIYLDLIESVAFSELSLHKIFTYAFDLRSHLYEALEAKGYIKEAVLTEHCFFNGKFKNVVIHSKIATPLYLRLADINDIRLYFEWSNEEDVRKNSFNPARIEWEVHSAWFKNKLGSEQSILYVLMEGRIAVGQVRLDKEGEFWLINYSVDRDYRGRGLAKEMIRLLLNTGLRPLKAKVKGENTNSLKVFQNNLFIAKEDYNGNEKIYIFFKYE